MTARGLKHRLREQQHHPSHTTGRMPIRRSGIDPTIAAADAWQHLRIGRRCWSAQRSPATPFWLANVLRGIRPSAALLSAYHGSFLLGRLLRPQPLSLDRHSLAHRRVSRKLCLQDQLWEKHCTPHSGTRAHIYQLVLIGREQLLTFSEGGNRRGHADTSAVLPNVDEALLLSVVDSALQNTTSNWKAACSAWNLAQGGFFKFTYSGRQLS